MSLITRLGYYMPSKHNASSVVSIDGIAPCVMENHGTVTAIVVGGGTEDDEGIDYLDGQTD